jgi:hypothetical protein
VKKEEIQSERFLDEPDAEVSALLMWIRFFSFQDQMRPGDTATLPVYPDLSKAEEGLCRTYLLECCTTEHTVTEAMKRVAAHDVVPAHHYLLVDAYAAQRGHDYQQCMLYAAMAVESLATTRLEQEYTARLGGGGPDVRIIGLPLAGGATAWKDPIYGVLVERTDFSDSLHKRPLYLMGKSLLVEHPETYRRAVMLYSTRNRIVHRGELSEGDAWLALCCVSDIFQWFGEASIKFPDRRMVKFLAVDWELPD